LLRLNPQLTRRPPESRNGEGDAAEDPEDGATVALIFLLISEISFTHWWRSLCGRFRISSRPQWKWYATKPTSW